MHYALAMRRIQRLSGLRRQPHGFFHGLRPFERPSFDVFEHQVVRPDFVNLADARMIQRPNRTRFLLEAGAVLALEALHRHDAIKPGVPGLPHLAHPARPDGRKQRVRPDLQTGFPGRHGLSILADRSAALLEALPDRAHLQNESLHRTLARQLQNAAPRLHPRVGRRWRSIAPFCPWRFSGGRWERAPRPRIQGKRGERPALLIRDALERIVRNPCCVRRQSGPIRQEELRARTKALAAAVLFRPQGQACPHDSAAIHGFSTDGRHDRDFAIRR
jgi:hypothetical protein